MALPYCRRLARDQINENPRKIIAKFGGLGDYFSFMDLIASVEATIIISTKNNPTISIKQSSSFHKFPRKDFYANASSVLR